uniref:subtilisin n=1 Tax=Globisporangium ultimum (strain ATCC 200006 / CBS 805.95 / DAOM BR144) TaxID=431595 RepID=K3WEZ4_GLOUD
MNIRFATFLAAIAAVAGCATAAPKVHSSVHRKLQSAGTVNLIVTLAETTESTLESFQEAAYVSRTARIQALKAKLEAAHIQAVAPVSNLLSQESASTDALFADYKTFWISNQVFIESATFDLVAKLMELPSVAEIREEALLTASKEVAEAADVQELVGQEWNIQRIGANKVWADGNIGQNVIVASIGSGVRYTHEALKSNFLGDFGWYEPKGNATKPYDVSGFGTHAMGIVAGSQGVGVAPGAKWSACKACNQLNCPESEILACSQFIMCPSNPQGTVTDCTKAPRVVHNAWYSAQNDFWFKPTVDAWEKVDIVSVFQAGDFGPSCGTVTSPGDYPNAITVGSIGNTNTLSTFGGKGPTVEKRVKPDLVAPGSRIRSATNTSDSEYMTKSGTSIAAAHVAGTVALLLSYQPDFSVSEVKVALYTTTDQTGISQTAASNLTCGGLPDGVWPNNQFGHGLVNALNLYEGFRPAP